MSAPRIDTFRNSLAETIRSLESAGEHVATLHSLAYSRHQPGLTERVGGGSSDYALDTHGDPRAQAAYRSLNAAVVKLGADTVKAVNAALSLLADGEVKSRRDQSADARVSEVVEALAAQGRRMLRGEVEHVASQQQPLPRGVSRFTDVARLEGELEALRGVVRKSGIRVDRSRWTPLELAAFNGAHGVKRVRRRKKAG